MITYYKAPKTGEVRMAYCFIGKVSELRERMLEKRIRLN